MHIFFDTEFTQFRDGELLSIGFLSDAGHELVVEVHDPGRFSRASEFCRNVVIAQFGTMPASIARSDAEVGCTVARWLGQFEGLVTMLFDYKQDWYYFEHVLRMSGDWPNVGPRVVPLNVADVAKYDGCLAAQEEYFRGLTVPGRHHPLVDARALRVRWQTYLQLEGLPGAA